MPQIDLRQFESARSTRPKANKEKKNTSSPGNKFDLWALMNKDFSLGGTGLSDKKKERLYLELGSLLQAGIDLKSSLELMTMAQEKPKDRQLFQAIQDKVLSGVSFSSALEQSGQFSAYEIFSQQIGEETGKLNEVLRELAIFYQNKIKQRRKISSALSYPLIVMTTCIGAIFFMLEFVVPMFGEIFKRFGGELPWITRTIIQASKTMGNSLLPAALLVIAIAVFLWIVRKQDQFRRIATGLVQRLPVVGELVQKIYLGRFCNSMRLLIGADIPLLRAITLSRQMIGYYPIETSLKQVEEDILKGSSLYRSIQQFRIYPPKMVQLIKIGEESKQLDFFFGKISEQYVEEVEYRTGILTAAMQPIIIIILGLVVGTILIAMYLPMFQMSNTLQ